MRFRPLLVFAAIVAGSFGPAAPAQAEKVCVFAMPAEIVGKVFSGTARAGQPFTFRIAQDAVLDDGTRIEAGTIGYGIVRGARPAARGDQDGLLALEPRYLVVRKPTGDFMRVQVTMNPTLPPVYSPTELLLNNAASHVIPGLIMSGVNQVRWGRNITLGPGFAFSVLAVDNLARGPVC